MILGDGSRGYEYAYDISFSPFAFVQLSVRSFSNQSYYWPNNTRFLLLKQFLGRKKRKEKLASVFWRMCITTSRRLLWVRMHWLLCVCARNQGKDSEKETFINDHLKTLKALVSSKIISLYFIILHLHIPYEETFVDRCLLGQTDACGRSMRKESLVNIFCTLLSP